MKSFPWSCCNVLKWRLRVSARVCVLCLKVHLSTHLLPHIPPQHTLHLSVHYQSHRLHTVALQLTFDEENIERSGVSLNRFFGREFWSDDVPLAVEYYTVHFRYRVGYNRLTKHYSISGYYIEYTIFDLPLWRQTDRQTSEYILFSLLFILWIIYMYKYIIY